ncbi:hypothetical protein CP972_10555 [Streptomyces prasinus]|uniref:Uncharacterized protein n=1 Tax=Streptomyces prasinus TaxID=67345 RepID=A0ABX6AUC7_9ACTN|nr:hypothetical protein CP972_10555 [Streptomyces prasinus]
MPTTGAGAAVADAAPGPVPDAAPGAGPAAGPSAGPDVVADTRPDAGSDTDASPSDMWPLSSGVLRSLCSQPCRGARQGR